MKELNLKPHSFQHFLEAVQAQGFMHFTSQDYQNATGLKEHAAWASIRRARETGKIATPYRGFHVIVPPQYRAIGCLPAERFVPELMRFLAEPYYVGLLSAAAYHGASHQAPQEYQVFVKKNRPSIEVGKVRISFIARNNLEQMPLANIQTSQGELPISTPELTAFDLVGYVDHAVGFDHAATVLSELAEKISSSKLRGVAPIAGPIRWSQRLGYLLQKVGAKSKTHALARYVDEQSPRYSKLDQQGPNEGEKDKTWRLIVNAEIESDI